jgi:hypothetical protein
VAATAGEDAEIAIEMGSGSTNDSLGHPVASDPSDAPTIIAQMNAALRDLAPPAAVRTTLAISFTQVTC